MENALPASKKTDTRAGSAWPNEKASFSIDRRE
jgi:hypothetical protein